MFQHHPDGVIRIGALVYPLAEFLIDEPTYALPQGAIGRIYEPGDRNWITDGESQIGGPMPWPEGDAYLANEAKYTAAYALRLNPPPTLTEAQAAKLAELVAARNEAIIAPVSWSSAEWSALPEDQENLIQAVALWGAALHLTPDEQAQLGAPMPTDIPWKTIANDRRNLTYLEAVQLATAISIHKQSMFGVYWQLEDAVAAAKSVADVQAITWPK